MSRDLLAIERSLIAQCPDSRFLQHPKRLLVKIVFKIWTSLEIKNNRVNTVIDGPVVYLVSLK